MPGHDHPPDEAHGLNGSRPPRRNRAEEDALDSWRRLMVQLAFELEGEGAAKGRVLMLTRPVEHRNSADASLELAHFLAEEQGRRVLIVDCAFGEPELSKRFGCDGAPGLLGLLKPGSQADLAALVVPTSHEGVSFLPLGSAHAGIGGVAAPDALRRVLDRMRTEFDDVLLHCRPILEDSATRAVPAAADCVLLFSSEGVTRLKDLDESQKVLAACKARRVGLVLTTPRRRSGRG